MRSWFPLQKDIELDAGIDFEFFPSQERADRLRKAKSIVAYDRKILRKLMSLRFSPAEIKRIERSAAHEFSLGWFCEHYCPPVHILATNIHHVAPYDLYGNIRKTAVWRAFWYAKKICWPQGDSKGVVFRMTGLGDHIIHREPAVPPEPGTASIMIRSRDDRDSIIITPFKSFLVGLKRVWAS